MRKIRVLVVDASAVNRRLLAEILSRDPALKIVGTAANGFIALEKLPRLNPDVVTLDVKTSQLDGMSVLSSLRKSYRSLPLVMVTTQPEEGAAAALESLTRKANDCVVTPDEADSATTAMETVGAELIVKIKSLCPFSSETVHQEAVQQETAGLDSVEVSEPPGVSQLRRPASRCDVVVIGASTGGPQALSDVLEQLPDTFPVPIVIVQHMPAVLTRHLAGRLNQECALQVFEAQDGDELRAGTVLIAPGDFHLEIQRQGVAVVTRLNQGPRELFCRPAVDVLFRSAAKVYGVGCHAVVLTGMGQDGKSGAKSIVDVGGSVIAQDQASCVVWGMPRAVTEAGLVSQVLPLDQISNELLRRVAVSRQPAVVSESL